MAKPQHVTTSYTDFKKKRGTRFALSTSTRSIASREARKRANRLSDYAARGLFAPSYSSNSNHNNDNKTMSFELVGDGEDVVDDWQHEQEGQVRGAANQALVRRLAVVAAIGSGRQQ